METLKNIKEIEKISLGPDDVLAVRVGETASEYDIETIQVTMKEIFPNNKVLLIKGDVQFQAIVAEKT
jgi:hypothetical protein